MTLQTMYPAIVNSPFTELAQAIDNVQTTITVADGSKLPDAPNIATLGMGEDAETILYQEKVGNTLSQVTRGFQGNAKSWNQGVTVARMFTAYDFDSLRGNITTVDGKVNDVGQALDVHKADYATFKNNIEAIRYVDEKLELKINGEWIEFKSGDGYPVGNVSNLNVSIGNDGEVTLTWQDPSDVTVTDSNGNVITIARWSGTKLVRKSGSYPVNENDGTLLVDNKTRNRYQSNGFTDTGLSNGTTYYYMLFPYTEEDVVTVDSANRISATPQAYDDLSGSPGPKNLIGGTMDAGFFGEVPASELFTASEIASECGISQGTVQNNNEPWLKFAIDGKIIFRPRKAIRHSISWDAINSANCVYGGSGGKTVTKNGMNYRVRLMKGALTDPSKNEASDRGAKGSEWNRLMLPIHEQAIDKSWAYPAYVEDNVPIWSHDFGNGNQGMYTDADLLTHINHGNGSHAWQQETTESNASHRVNRGYNGVSYSYWDSTSQTGSIRGWVPVLELL